MILTIRIVEKYNDDIDDDHDDNDDDGDDDDDNGRYSNGDDYYDSK